MEPETTLAKNDRVVVFPNDPEASQVFGLVSSIRDDGFEVTLEAPLQRPDGEVTTGRIVPIQWANIARLEHATTQRAELEPPMSDSGFPGVGPGPTNGDAPAIDLRWEIDLADDGIHVIEIPPPGYTSGPARSFRCDGVEFSLGGLFHRAPRVAQFAIAGHPATMTMWSVRPRWGTRFRRALGGELRPWVLLAFLFGHGVGGGAAGAAAATTILSWTIYELKVDGKSRGSYIARSVGGKLQSWTLVEPGGSLPDGSIEDWPVARPRTAKGS